VPKLAFEVSGFSRDMVFMLQGLIVLFAGAMAQVAAPALSPLYGAGAPVAEARPWMRR
jgi:general nucleoside transport system permease protein